MGNHAIDTVSNVSGPASATAISKVFRARKTSQQRLTIDLVSLVDGMFVAFPNINQVNELNNKIAPNPLRTISHLITSEIGATKKVEVATPRLDASIVAPLIKGSSFEGNHCKNNGPIAEYNRMRPNPWIARSNSKREKLSVAMKAVSYTHLTLPTILLV